MSQKIFPERNGLVESESNCIYTYLESSWSMFQSAHWLCVFYMFHFYATHIANIFYDDIITIFKLFCCSTCCWGKLRPEWKGSSQTSKREEGREFQMRVGPDNLAEGNWVCFVDFQWVLCFQIVAYSCVLNAWACTWSSKLAPFGFGPP